MAVFAELGARSNFSFLDGASRPEELAQTARAKVGLLLGVFCRRPW